LLLAGEKRSHHPVSLSLDSASLLQDKVCIATENSETAHASVGCGRISESERILIVNPETLSECPVNHVGEIWVATASVAQGYWRRPAETEEKFHAKLVGAANTPFANTPFLRTGDLGFLFGNELHITGRLKDLIIIRGANYYPQDIERTVEEAHPVVRHNCSAAFSVEVEN
jgi:acyl-CoA synthetase (AMP-forming)/AMP-acid ligase II